MPESTALEAAQPFLGVVEKTRGSETALTAKRPVSKECRQGISRIFVSTSG
jgi:hypothetical protein